jgi:hypothetical protein
MAATVEPLAWTDVQLEGGGTLGLGSGLTARDGRVFAVTDRGPNLFISQAIADYGLTGLEALRGIRDAKVMPRPSEGPEIVELRLEAGAVQMVRRMRLRTRSGQRLSGAPPPGAAEPLFDMSGQKLPPEALGADTEAIAVMPDGGFFVADEYVPSLLKVDADGVVSERWVPAGCEAVLAHDDVAVRGILPERATRRRANRGFEALCASADGRWLYVGFQSALEGEDPSSVPIWKLDARTGELAAEYLYAFDAPETFLRDASRRKVGAGDLKVCEIAWTGEDRLVVLERIAHSAKLHAIDLARLPEKRMLVSTDDHPEVGADMEGMVLLSPTEILLVSDNDFGVEGARTEFWRIALDAAI